MPINPICNLCNKPINEFGGLIFSPPLPPDFKLTEKSHVCKDCYNNIVKILTGTENQNDKIRRLLEYISQNYKQLFATWLFQNGWSSWTEIHELKKIK